MVKNTKIIKNDFILILYVFTYILPLLLDLFGDLFVDFNNRKMNQDIPSSPQTPQQIYTDSHVVPNAPLRGSKNGGHVTHNSAGLLQPIQLNFDNTNVNPIVNINWKG